MHRGGRAQVCSRTFAYIRALRARNARYYTKYVFYILYNA